MFPYWNSIGVGDSAANFCQGNQLSIQPDKIRLNDLFHNTIPTRRLTTTARFVSIWLISVCALEYLMPHSTFSLVEPPLMVILISRISCFPYKVITESTVTGRKLGTAEKDC